MTARGSGRRAYAGRALILALGAAAVLMAAPALVDQLSAYGAWPSTFGGVAGVALRFVGVMVEVTIAYGLWLTPGWLIARRLAPRDGAPVIMLRALCLAFAVQACVHAVFIAMGGAALPPGSHRLATLGTGALLVGLTALIVDPPRPDRTAGERPRVNFSELLIPIAVVILLALLLLPRLFWQDFNPDGLEFFSLGRSLGSHVLPRFPNGDVPGGNFGLIAPPYLVDWSIEAFGFHEAASRLPILLYSATLFAGVQALAERKSPRRLTRYEQVLVSAGAAGFVLALAWNGSYDPYATDVAMPATADALLLASVLATAYFVFEGELAWSCLGALLMLLTRPSGLMMCGLLFGGTLLLARRERRIWIVAALITVVTCVGFSWLYTRVLAPLSGDRIGEGAGDLLSRLRFLRFDDYRRVLFLLVPTGIVPALSLLRWRRMDTESRVLALVILGYFAFFYSLAYYGLHHFAPIMLLPLAVFWRMRAQERPTTAVPAVVIAAGIALAWYAASPGNAPTYRESRVVGQQLRFEIGNYLGSDEQRRRAFEAKAVLDSLFPPDDEFADPRQVRIGDSWVFVHYGALHPPAPDSAQYVVRAASEPGPVGMQHLTSLGGAALYVRDPTLWHWQRSHPPPPYSTNAIYTVPREMQSQQLGRPEDVAQIDLREVIARWRRRD